MHLVFPNKPTPPFSRIIHVLLKGVPESGFRFAELSVGHEEEVGLKHSPVHELPIMAKGWHKPQPFRCLRPRLTKVITGVLCSLDLVKLERRSLVTIRGVRKYLMSSFYALTTRSIYSNSDDNDLVPGRCCLRLLDILDLYGVTFQVALDGDFLADEFLHFFGV